MKLDAKIHRFIMVYHGLSSFYRILPIKVARKWGLMPHCRRPILQTWNGSPASMLEPPPLRSIAVDLKPAQLWNSNPPFPAFPMVFGTSFSENNHFKVSPAILKQILPTSQWLWGIMELNMSFDSPCRSAKWSASAYYCNDIPAADCTQIEKMLT